MVKTFHYPRLIPQHLTGSELPNWESSASPTLLLGTFPIQADILYFNNIYVIDGTPGTVYATSPTPEPGTLMLFGSAFIGMIARVVRARP